MLPPTPTTLGIDVGTSGARACIVTANQPPTLLRATYHTPTSPAAWHAAVQSLIASIPPQDITALCVDGTSATTLLVDASTGQLLADHPIMYNQPAPEAAVAAAQRMCPDAASTALAPTAALPKLLSWVLDGTVDRARAAGHDPVLCHQADWISGLLMMPGGARFAISSYNNCLKLGYDVRRLCWPEWLLQDDTVASLLPRRVAAPGDVVGECLLMPGSTTTTQCCAGTTDSIAAFVASGACRPGDAVTSLGSTLALKLLSAHPIDDDPSRGIYCHRLGDAWLVGGASSSGCAVLRERVGSDDVLSQLSSQIEDWTAAPRVHLPTPLPDGVTHDRFLPAQTTTTTTTTTTTADGHRRDDEEQLSPTDRLYALLHAIASIEARGYAALREAGSSPLQRCWTAGGGGANEGWRVMRQEMLGVAVERLESPRDEAAYGSALLARRGVQ